MDFVELFADVFSVDLAVEPAAVVEEEVVVVVAAAAAVPAQQYPDPEVGSYL